MAKVLVVATSRKTRGGITSVVKAHKTGEQWKKYHCVWIQTHRDGPIWRKLIYLLRAWLEYLVLLPFYDAVHIHSAGQSSAKRKLLFARLARKCRKVVIVHFHPPGPDDIFSAKSHDVVKKLFDLADKVIVLSPQWERWIKEAFPDRNYQMVVLWNPCPAVKRVENNKKKHILYAGTLCKRKGYDVLLRAFGMIANKYPDWKIVFAGNPYLLDGYNELDDGKHLAKELGIDNQVEWLGWVCGEEKDKVFNEASIYCLASTGEGFPMGVLDAWAYGIPCVMTPVGGIPDIVENGIHGLLIPIGDSTKMACALDKMMGDEILRTYIVSETDKLVATTFNISSICHELGDIYDSII